MDDTITITCIEYESLREAAETLEDVQAYDAAMAKREEGLPHEFMVRLIEGDNPVRVWREFRGLSGAELARQAGLNRVQVHDIETGKRNGSTATIKVLADALRTTVDDLI